MSDNAANVLIMLMFFAFLAFVIWIMNNHD